MPRKQSIKIELRRTVVRVLTISAGSSIVSKVLRRTDPLRVDDCSMSPTEGGSTLTGCSVFSGSTPSWRNQPTTTSGTALQIKLPTYGTDLPTDVRSPMVHSKYSTGYHVEQNKHLASHMANTSKVGCFDIKADWCRPCTTPQP